LSLVLKIHSLAALNALQTDIAALARTAQDGNLGIKAETVRNVELLFQPVPDTFPLAVELPWDAFAFPLRVCLARSRSYGGDAVLFDDGAGGSNANELVLSGMTPSHVSSLLDMTTDDVPGRIMRNDLNPAGTTIAGALVDQSVLPWISRAVREGFFLWRVAQH